MSHYVHRMKGDREGWVGPIRSPRQAQREKEAWEHAGWAAVVHETSPDVRAAVRGWEKRVAERRRREGRVA